MPSVESSIQIKAQPQTVYEFASDMERYSQFMADVERITVLERNGNKTISEWVTQVEGIPISWKEEDTFLDDRKMITYKLIEGDLDKFDGEWTFEPEDGGTKVTLTVEFDFGMPTLADLLGPILDLKVRENSQMMLEGMKREVEA